MNDQAQELIEEGRAARREGRLDVARDRYQAAAEVLREADAPLRLAHTVRHVADIQSELGELEQAHANFADALAIYRAQADTGKLDLANTLRGYALLLEKLEDAAAARAMWEEARELYNAVGVQAGVDEAERQLHRLS